MRKVERGQKPPPANLQAKNKQGLTELDRARAHQADANPKKGAFEFAAYKDEEVKRRLEELFHGKCAYCETFFSASAPVDVEHFRPKGAVSDDDTHPGYWWLGMVWTNLLPSCIDCNRKRQQRSPPPSTSLVELYEHSKAHALPSSQTGKKDSFPLAAGGRRLFAESNSYADEKALLLDPTRDDPTEHLRFFVGSPLGLVGPETKSGVPSERGAMSIQIYGLNRLGLVQDRTRVLRQLEFLGDLAIDLGAIIQEIEDANAMAALHAAGVQRLAERLRLLQDRTLAEMRAMAGSKAPYSAMARTWLDEFIRRL
jgi:hypothetical protein